VFSLPRGKLLARRKKKLRLISSDQHTHLKTPSYPNSHPILIITPPLTTPPDDNNMGSLVGSTGQRGSQRQGSNTTDCRHEAGIAELLGYHHEKQTCTTGDGPNNTMFEPSPVDRRPLQPPNRPTRSVFSLYVLGRVLGKTVGRSPAPGDRRRAQDMTSSSQRILRILRHYQD